MPTKAMRPCAAPGCATLVSDGRFCPAHKRGQDAARDRVRGTAAERGYGNDWRKLRMVVLQSDPLCADPYNLHCEAGQVVIATEVDHITPKEYGGQNMLENLQPLCRYCHQRKHSGEGNAYSHVTRVRSLVPLTIVTGAPGAGKTTYVQQHMHEGDLVVDVDALYSALSGQPWYSKPDTLLPLVLAARDAVLARLGKPSGIRHAWWITTEANALTLDRLAETMGAQLVVLDQVSPTECMTRIAKDPRRADRAHLWRQLVSKWFEKYETTKLHRSSALYAETRTS